MLFLLNLHREIPHTKVLRKIIARFVRSHDIGTLESYANPSVSSRLELTIFSVSVSETYWLHGAKRFCDDAHRYRRTLQPSVPGHALVGWGGVPGIQYQYSQPQSYYY